MKAVKVSGGYTIKRKARVEHECHDCGCLIEPGEEYYQLTLRGFYSEWITKPICEQCWKGRELKTSPMFCTRIQRVLLQHLWC